jgi:membrane protein DedA with SNARE-associated domain
MAMNTKQLQHTPILSFLLGAGGLVLLVLGMRTAASILNPFLLALVLAFTIFGMANRLIFYYAGKRGGKDSLDKVHGHTPERANQLRSLYDRWGSLLFLITSVPVIGSSLTVMGGMKSAALPLFIVFAVISYLVRNWLMVFFSSGVVQLFQ